MLDGDFISFNRYDKIECNGRLFVYKMFLAT